MRKVRIFIGALVLMLSLSACSVREIELPISTSSRKTSSESVSSITTSRSDSSSRETSSQEFSSDSKEAPPFSQEAIAPSEEKTASSDEPATSPTEDTDSSKEPLVSSKEPVPPKEKPISPTPESSAPQKEPTPTVTESTPTKEPLPPPQPVTSSSSENESVTIPEPPQSVASEVENMSSIKITVGDQTFTATLETNSGATAFAELLKTAPVILTMGDYSGFEKVANLGTDLPTSNQQTTAQSGDIVLYNGNQIVLFYGSNSWSYTRLGKIDDLSGWATALGSGDVTVTFSLS